MCAVPERGESNTNCGRFAHRRYRLLLADDNPDVLRAARDLLSREFDIMAAVRDGAALLELAAKIRPDVIVADIYMPGMTGFDSCLGILQGGFCNSVVLLSMHSNPDLVEEAVRGGMKGFVLKEDAGEELCAAVETAAAGGVYLSAGARRAVSNAQRRRRK